MASSNRSRRRVVQKIVRRVRTGHREEDGKITLVACIMMLAMVVLTGLIGNAGHAVNQKLETQNAADAVAFSASLWMARGMNALTATNHLLGEATALCAIHEALGGPGLDLQIRQNTSENRVLDGIIDATRRLAPVGHPVPSPFGYTPPPVRDLDKRLVDFVTNRTTPATDRELEAFATIYDARMTLKRELAALLPLKSFANAGFFVPPPWGYATAAAAYGVHTYASAQIVLIGKEWVLLDVLETVAKAFVKLKLSVIEAQLIPTLVAHGDFIASYDPESGEFQEGILNAAIQRTVLDIQDRHKVQVDVFPAVAQIRLPVMPEPAPELRSTGRVAGWGEDKAIPVSLGDSGLGDLQNDLRDATQEMDKLAAQLSDDLDQLDRFQAQIDERLQNGDVSDEERAELEEEKRAIQGTRDRLQQRLDELQSQRTQLEQRVAQLERLLTQPTPASQNPSVERVPILMNQQQEKSTQWVRAAHPYTDSFRAPIRAMFQNLLPKSKAADHFTKWSNRYTMIKAWQFRSGYRMERSGNSAVWQKDESQEPLRMFVLRDSFDGTNSRKGNEPWAGSTPAGKAQAEDYFTLIGFAHRDFKSLFSSVVYPVPNQAGLTCFAQAIVYNANGQQSSGSGDFQAKLGWDTLNWDPQVSVPEWAAPASDSNQKWPWEVFTSDAGRVKVKLNWQPKLMPVTSSRLQESNEDLDANLAENVEHAIDYFDSLGTH